MKALCTKCNGLSPHSEIQGYMYCKKCGVRNAITLKRASLIYKEKLGNHYG